MFIGNRKPRTKLLVTHLSFSHIALRAARHHISDHIAKTIIHSVDSVMNECAVKAISLTPSIAWMRSAVIAVSGTQRDYFVET